MLRGHWSIARRSGQIADGPVARTVIGEPLVISRSPSGEVAALIDRCAHRNLALSRGAVTADGLRCAHHGGVALRG